MDDEQRERLYEAYDAWRAARTGTGQEMDKIGSRLGEPRGLPLDHEAIQRIDALLTTEERAKDAYYALARELYGA